MKLSILCICYNHQDFIKDALDSFLMQDMAFEYEIIVSDDASTDGTKDIISEYQKKYPNIIKPIFNSENIGPMRNFIQGLAVCEGDYIAYSDGDDYWIDPKKITTQIKVLDKFDKCSFSFHDTAIVDCNGVFISELSKGRVSQYFETGVINSRDIVSSPNLIAHANSLLFRRKCLDFEYLRSLGEIVAGDFALVVLLCNSGNGYYIKALASAYRRHPLCLSNLRLNDIEKLRIESIEIGRKIDDYFNRKFNKEISRHLKGRLVTLIESTMRLASKEKKYLQYLAASLRLIINHIGSQYTFRDSIWLIRKYWHVLRE